MLFSNIDIAALLNSTFECSWESVRPVPKIDIDFGNGYRLERTLNGNIATWFCTPDGGAFDVVPGLVQPDEFLLRAVIARELHTTLSASSDPARFLDEFHRVATPKEVAERTGAPLDSHETDRLGLLIALLPPAHTPRPQDASAIFLDTLHNREERMPLVHALLRQNPFARPADLTTRVYEEILHVKITDPYLGLAPYVLGGEIGRREPAAENQTPLTPPQGQDR